MCFRPNEVSVAEKPLVCPACGNENAPGEDACIFCGADLPEQDAGNPLPPAPGAPAMPQPPAAGAPAAPR